MSSFTPHHQTHPPCSARSHPIQPSPPSRTSNPFTPTNGPSNPHPSLQCPPFIPHRPQVPVIRKMSRASQGTSLASDICHRAPAQISQTSGFAATEPGGFSSSEAFNAAHLFLGPLSNTAILVLLTNVDVSAATIFTNTSNTGPLVLQPMQCTMRKLWKQG